LNGIKTYNLSAGKTTPQFMEEAAKKKVSLRYNNEFRRRIEII
jgi:ribosome biogenesis protein ENP2